MFWEIWRRFRPLKMAQDKQMTGNRRKNTYMSFLRSSGDLSSVLWSLCDLMLGKASACPGN